MENQLTLKRSETISALFLVAGTCIGGGMLALPVATGISGFLPSMLMMFVCWLAMTATALLLLEVSLWMEEGVHVISMTSRMLGLPGKTISWVLYLFICYASIVAYTAGGGIQIASAFNAYLNILMPKDVGSIIFILLFGPVIYLGTHLVGRVNAVLFIAMVAAYLALVGIGIPEVRIELLSQRRWSGAFLAIPLLLTSFSFQTMVPSLTPMLKKNVKSLRSAIIGGTLLSFLIYAIWQWLMLGIVPVEGPNGLAQALLKGEPATQFLREYVSNSWVYVIAEYFAFFAIATSFLGIALGLFDFLADGLKIKKEGWGNVILALLIAMPTMIFATQFERIFILALETSGGFGDSILNGLIPVLMVWVGRYRRGFLSNVQVPGGKFALALIFCFFLGSLVLEIMLQMGHLSPIYAPIDVD